MPIPRHYGGVSAENQSGAAGVEREVSRLRQEMDALRKQLERRLPSHDGATGHWVTTAMAALALILGLVAVLRR